MGLVCMKRLQFTIFLLVLPTEVVLFEFQETVPKRNVDIWKIVDLLPIAIPTRLLMSWSKPAVWMNKLSAYKEKKSSFFFLAVMYLFHNLYINDVHSIHRF